MSAIDPLTLPAPPTTGVAVVPSTPPTPPLVPREGGNAMFVMLLQIGAMIAIFYFLLIRPQRKERARHQEMLKKLGKGDQVLTNGGIVGQVVHATDTELTIRTAESTRIVLDRGYVARKVDPAAQAGARK